MKVKEHIGKINENTVMLDHTLREAWLEFRAATFFKCRPILEIPNENSLPRKLEQVGLIQNSRMLFLTLLAHLSKGDRLQIVAEGPGNEVTVLEKAVQVLWTLSEYYPEWKTHFIQVRAMLMVQAVFRAGNWELGRKVAQRLKIHRFSSNYPQSLFHRALELDILKLLESENTQNCIFINQRFDYWYFIKVDMMPLLKDVYKSFTISLPHDRMGQVIMRQHKFYQVNADNLHNKTVASKPPHISPNSQVHAARMLKTSRSSRTGEHMKPFTSSIMMATSRTEGQQCEFQDNMPNSNTNAERQTDNSQQYKTTQILKRDPDFCTFASFIKKCDQNVDIISCNVVAKKILAEKSLQTSYADVHNFGADRNASNQEIPCSDPEGFHQGLNCGTSPTRQSSLKRMHDKHSKLTAHNNVEEIPESSGMNRSSEILFHKAIQIGSSEASTENFTIVNSKIPDSFNKHLSSPVVNEGELYRVTAGNDKLTEHSVSLESISQKSQLFNSPEVQSCTNTSSWTAEENLKLAEAVFLDGLEGKWTEIKLIYDLNRTEEDIKNNWRNIMSYPLVWSNLKMLALLKRQRLNILAKADKSVESVQNSCAETNQPDQPQTSEIRAEHKKHSSSQTCNINNNIPMPMIPGNAERKYSSFCATDLKENKFQYSAAKTIQVDQDHGLRKSPPSQKKLKQTKIKNLHFKNGSWTKQEVMQLAEAVFCKDLHGCWTEINNIYHMDRSRLCIKRKWDKIVSNPEMFSRLRSLAIKGELTRPQNGTIEKMPSKDFKYGKRKYDALLKDKTLILEETKQIAQSRKCPQRKVVENYYKQNGSKNGAEEDETLKLDSPPPSMIVSQRSEAIHTPGEYKSKIGDQNSSMSNSCDEDVITLIAWTEEEELKLADGVLCQGFHGKWLEIKETYKLDRKLEEICSHWESITNNPSKFDKLLDLVKWQEEGKRQSKRISHRRSNEMKKCTKTNVKGSVCSSNQDVKNSKQHTNILCDNTRNSHKESGGLSKDLDTTRDCSVMKNQDIEYMDCIRSTTGTQTENIQSEPNDWTEEDELKLADGVLCQGLHGKWWKINEIYKLHRTVDDISQQWEVIANTPSKLEKLFGFVQSQEEDMLRQSIRIARRKFVETNKTKKNNI